MAIRLGSAGRASTGASVLGLSSNTRDCTSISVTGSVRGIIFGSDNRFPVNPYLAEESPRTHEPGALDVLRQSRFSAEGGTPLGLSQNIHALTPTAHPSAATLFPS